MDDRLARRWAVAGRWVVHVDLDAFFANAEVRRRPELRGRPVIVGGEPEGRGVVSSATYEARAYGVRSAVPLAEGARFLAPLPVGRIPGVGPKARERLAACGIHLIGELAAAPPPLLREVFGRRGAEVALLARGVDARPLVTERAAKSVGHERTFGLDVADPAELRRALRPLCERTAAQLRREGL